MRMGQTTSYVMKRSFNRSIIILFKTFVLMTNDMVVLLLKVVTIALVSYTENAKNARNLKS